MTPVARFLVAAAVIIFVCHVFGAVLRRLRQPAVVGEIAAGLVLGPTVFGALWPAGREALFPPEVMSAVSAAAQLGLVVFMFLMGCELRITRFPASPRAVATVTSAAIIVPFVAGILLALWVSGHLAGPVGRTGASAVFLGLALSITALPVLARILVDLGLHRSAVGVFAMTCAAAGDAVLWAALTALLAVAGLTGGGSALTSGGLALAFLAVTLLVVRPGLAAFVRWAHRRTDGIQFGFPILLAGALCYAGAAEVIGLHPVLGAFLFGVVMPRDEAVVERINQQVRGFAVAVLLPLFFAGVGLLTSVGVLTTPAGWLAFLAVLATAALTKFVGAGLGARLAGMGCRDSVRLGVLLNCRGITEIVVATIGYQYGLINRVGLTILVLTALVTTAMTTPLMRVLSGPAQVEPEPAGPVTRPPAGPAPAAVTSGR